MLEAKYSRNPFDGYTHRFQVRFVVKDQYNYTELDIYSNDDDYDKVKNMIEEKKSEKVLSYKISYRATKEQDDANTAFINEVLEGI